MEEGLLCDGYCGRVFVPGMNLSDIPCGPCPLGSRTDGLTCVLCEDNIDIYSIIFLLFEMVLNLSFYLIVTDKFSALSRRDVIWTVVMLLCEGAASILFPLLSLVPKGSLKLHSCGVETIDDFYPVFFNPRPDYIHKQHCVSEIVFPLLSFVLLQHAFTAAILIFIRLPLLRWKGKSMFSSTQVLNIKKGTYSHLLFLPALALLHLIFGGVLYYSYPFILFTLCAMITIVYEVQPAQERERGVVVWRLLFSLVLPFLCFLAIKEHYTNNDNLHYVWVSMGSVAPFVLTRISWPLTNPDRFSPSI
eukprot:m.65579 g.65579  ORF g.65579 m.65579 type:complete len:304 (+) comp11529_c0_seq1:67-978(+)